MDAQVKKACARCNNSERVEKSAYCISCRRDVCAEYKLRVDYNAQRRAKNPRKSLIEKQKAGLCIVNGCNEPRHTIPSGVTKSRCQAHQREYESAYRKKYHNRTLLDACAICGVLIRKARIAKGHELCLNCERKEASNARKIERKVTQLLTQFNLPRSEFQRPIPEGLSEEQRNRKKGRIIAEILKLAKERQNA